MVRLLRHMALSSVFVWLCDCNLVPFSSSVTSLVTSLVRLVVQFPLYHLSSLNDAHSLQCTSSEYMCVWLARRTPGEEAGDRAQLFLSSKAVFRTLRLLHHLQRMPPPASRSAILRLLNASRHTACPCHGCSTTGAAMGPLQAVMNLRKYAAPVEASNKEYAFEVRMFVVLRKNGRSPEVPKRLVGFCCEFALWRWGDQGGGDGF